MLAAYRCQKPNQEHLYGELEITMRKVVHFNSGDFL